MDPRVDWRAFLTGMLAAVWLTPVLTVGAVGLGAPSRVAAIICGLLAFAAGLWLFRTLRSSRPEVKLTQAGSRAWFIVTLLIAALAIAWTSRLAVFMADPARTDCSFAPSDRFRTEHSCFTAYAEGLRFAQAGDAILYEEGSYQPTVNGRLRPRFIGNLKVDVYHYPPPFLLLPAALHAIAPEFLALRAVWFTVQALIFAAGGLVLARWIGGAAGAWALSAWWLMLASPPFLQTLQQGNFQITAVPLAMIAFAWIIGRGGSSSDAERDGASAHAIANVAATAAASASANVSVHTPAHATASVDASAHAQEDADGRGVAVRTATGSASDAANERKALAVAGAALLAYAALAKIFPAVLGLFLLTGRRWRVVMRMAAAALLLVALTIALFGWAPFAQFLGYELPRIASGAAFPQAERPDPTAVNLSIYGLLVRARILGLTWLTPEVTRQLASLYGLVVLLLAALAGWRQARVLTMDQPRARLMLAQLALALLSLAAFRSPFVGAGYGYVPTLWLLTLLAAGAAGRARAAWLLTFAAVTLALVLTPSPIVGTLPSRTTLAWSGLVFIGVLALNLHVVLRALSVRDVAMTAHPATASPAAASASASASVSPPAGDRLLPGGGPLVRHGGTRPR